MVIVAKFGGSSVADAEQIAKVAEIMSEPERKYAVVSAQGKSSGQPYKVTELLYNIYDKRVPGWLSNGFIHKFNRVDMKAKDLEGHLFEVYRSISKDLSLKNDIQKKLMSELDELIMRQASIDHFVSRGEQFSARMVAEYMGATFVDAAEILYLTKNRNPDNRMTVNWMSRLQSIPGKVVVPGFYGRLGRNGSIAVLPRGGSDLTGALIAGNLHADCYENWTDVSGICVADPRLFEEHERDMLKIIESMTYREAREATYMGFEVLNDEAVHSFFGLAVYRRCRLSGSRKS